MSEWIELKKAFVWYRDKGTLAVIPVPPPLTGYFVIIIRHVGGGTVPAPVDYEMLLSDAMRRAEVTYASTVDNLTTT